MSNQNQSCCHVDDTTGASTREAPALPVFRPSYSSCYDQHAWAVTVGLPGVKKDDLSVTIENEILEVTATRHLDLPDGWRPLGSHEPARTYRLRLDVGPEVDPTAISGGLEDGLLTLRLPLRDEVKARSIEIK